MIQVALIGWAYWPNQETGATGAPLFSDFTNGQIDRIEIESNTGETLTLRVDAESSNWLHAPSGYRITEGKVETFLSNLGQVATGRLVTQTPASHSRLGVASNQFEAKVSVWADGVRQELFVGTAPTAQTIHVRIPNQNEVWLTDRLTENDVDIALRNWINTLYYSVERKDVMGLTIENDGGTHQFVQFEPAGQDAAGNSTAAVWGVENSPAGSGLDQAAFGNLLSRATSMRFIKPLGTEPKAAYALDTPIATITIQLENGTRKLIVGNYDPATDSYVVASDFNMIVQIPSSSLNDLINVAKDGLILDQPSEN